LVHTRKIGGKREVRALSRSLHDKPEQEITNQCREWPSEYGLRTEASEPFAARPSERLPTAYTGGAESSEVFYIGFLSVRHLPPYTPKHAEIGSGTLIEQFRKSFMEDEKIDKEEVWSAIRYLDPDEKEEDKEANAATIIAVLALLLIVGGVWVLLWFRLRQP
jgi:hypothetical protein